MIIYNSLTFQKEEFKPITEGRVLMYVCGPTVYDSPHLGHAKSAIVFDVIRRYFKFKGYDVKLVKNYTDIDDKIIKRANERCIDFKALSEQYIQDYEQIMELLNIEKDYKNPRATEVIDFMIKIIKELISKGNAYESNESVYFSVATFPRYRTLFWNVPDDNPLDDEEREYPEQTVLIDGVPFRVGAGEQENEDKEKKDPKDFALWKKSKEGEPFWQSPWGEGRPGWHIECTAMSIKYLGETIDIHGGGQDLKSPHHRNEIAQSEAYTGKTFVNYFMHNGFVNIDNEKMSKSLGNFFLVSDVAREYNPMVIRLFLLSRHYRKPINYSLETMEQAKANHDKLSNALRQVNFAPITAQESPELKELSDKLIIAREGIFKALDDDFNTPLALSELYTLIREINKAILGEKLPITEDFKSVFFQLMEDIGAIFGIFPNIKKLIEQGVDAVNGSDDLTKKLLEIIKSLRTELRKRKLYDLSDELRDKLKDLGINIEDK